MTQKIEPYIIDCECCGKKEVLGHVVSTSVPYSAAHCLDCLKVGIEPYFVLVVNTAMCNGLQNMVDEWKNHVEHCLKFYGKTLKEFEADVAADIKKMDDYFAASQEISGGETK